MTQEIAPPNLNLPTKDIGGYDVPILDKPYTQILAAIENEESPGTLEMNDYHGGALRADFSVENFCGTTHCIAGWATHLCGQQGRILEFRTGFSVAARMILEASSELEQPSFSPGDYRSLSERNHRSDINRRALDVVRELAAQEKRA